MMAGMHLTAGTLLHAHEHTEGHMHKVKSDTLAAVGLSVCCMYANVFLSRA